MLAMLLSGTMRTMSLPIGQLQFLVALLALSFCLYSMVAFCHKPITDQVILLIVPNFSKLAWMVSLVVPRGISLTSIDRVLISMVSIGEMVVVSIFKSCALSKAYCMLLAEVKDNLKCSGTLLCVIPLWNPWMFPKMALICWCFCGTVSPSICWKLIQKLWLGCCSI